MPQFVIVADDITGAADTSACFAEDGWATVISLSNTMIQDADVVVLSTESRDLDADAAARAVEIAVSAYVDVQSDSRPRWVYKKIDSLLRGHPREELLAMMAAMDETHTVVAPAFPAEGRTTVGGRQLVDNVPLESSQFGDRWAESDLRALFTSDHGPPVQLLDLKTVRGQPDELRRLLDDGSKGIVIADAETDDDLVALGRAAIGGRLHLLCGTAGLARQLVRFLPLTPDASRPSRVLRDAGPILIVAGSQHATTKRQIDTLRQAGVPIVRPAQDFIDDPAIPIDATVAEVAAHLGAGRSTALTTVGLVPCSRGKDAVAARLAQVVASPEVSSQTGGLVLTGGDVAAAVCSALNVEAVWLRGEISPGLPWGVLAGGRLNAGTIATKAGSFGGDDALLMCVDHLTSTALIERNETS